MKNENNHSCRDNVQKIAQTLYEKLGRDFPVACASDEFYYFPQVPTGPEEMMSWDVFSPEKITETVGDLSSCEKQLNKTGQGCEDREIQIDINLLTKLAVTLREQFNEVRFWEKQPTFYLTLAGIGLAESLHRAPKDAIHVRACNLAAFLHQGAENLKNIPVLFRDLGLEMIPDMRKYFLFLQQTLPGIKSALSALDVFEKAVKNVSTTEGFALSGRQLTRVISYHIGSEATIREIDDILDTEISEIKKVLGRNWRERLAAMPVPQTGPEGAIGLYADEVKKLAKHCLGQGLISAKIQKSCPVTVNPMPAYLAAIRTASSYSISPGSPPAGGQFFVVASEQGNVDSGKNLLEYSMLTAHETYPGHHLLDISRWGLNNTVRRVVEQPLFYEGWACFAEELMRLSGYFTTSEDLLLLARRRYWRAVRGKVDLGLQRGNMDLESSAAFLIETGISERRARSAVRRYPLNPGYQLCYTVGLRKFLNIYRRYGKNDIQYFSRMVLGRGEIMFTDLENEFKRSSQIEKT